MIWKRFSSDATQTAGPVRIPVPETHHYSPYAEAWKRFDKLNAAVHGRGPFRWIRGVFELVLFGGAGVGLKFWHNNRLLVSLLWPCYLGFGFAYMQVIKRRFRHWQCPRCHAEWPGTKNEKDSACRVCGLRLHQLAP